MPYFDENTHPTRRQDDRLDEHAERIAKLEVRQSSYEHDIASLSAGLKEGAAAVISLASSLEKLGNKMDVHLVSVNSHLDSMRPIIDAYSDIRGFAKVMDWLVKHAKTIAFVSLCGWTAFHTPAILRLLGL